MMIFMAGDRESQTAEVKLEGEPSEPVDVGNLVRSERHAYAEVRLRLTPEVKRLIETCSVTAAKTEIRALWKEMILIPLLLGFTLASGALAVIMAMWSIIHAIPFIALATFSYYTYRAYQKRPKASP